MSEAEVEAPQPLPTTTALPENRSETQQEEVVDANKKESREKSKNNQGSIPKDKVCC